MSIVEALRGLRWLAAIIVLPALASGCSPDAEKALVPGVSTERDVRAKLGRPEIIWQLDHGHRELQYPARPGYRGMLVVTIGADSVLRSLADAFDVERLNRVSLGASRDDIRRDLGLPDERFHYALSGNEVWRWWVRLADVDPHSVEATFNEQGRLIEFERRLASAADDSI